MAQHITFKYANFISYFSWYLRKYKILKEKNNNPILRLSGQMDKVLKVGDKKINPIKIKK